MLNSVSMLNYTARQRVFALILGVIIALFATIQTGHTAALNNETVQSVIGEMGKINTQMKTILEENDGLVIANVNLVKKNKLWQEQLATRIVPKETLFKAKVKAHLEREARYKEIIDRHNDGCPDGVATSNAQYERCKGEEPYLNRIRNEHHAEKAVLRQERTDLIRERTVYVDRITANNTKITANFNRHLAVKAAVEDYTENLEYYRTRLIDLCAEADTDRDGEALHHCNAVSWDGAKQSLPPLDQILRGTQFFK